MIGIKGMQMPISTQRCPFFKRDVHLEGTAIITGMFCLASGKRICDVDNILESYSCKRCPDCPLVDLGSEDMSWEDLKEKCKQIKDTENIIFTFEANEEVLIVKKLNRYFRQNTTDLTPFQMWQIINALTGENK